MKKFVVIIRGAPASGKTTISRNLSRKFAKSFHIDIDKIRHASPKAKLTPKEFILASKAAAALSNVYFSKGYNIMIDSTFIRPEYLDVLLKDLKAKPIFLFTLKPDLKELLARDKSRVKFKRMGKRVKILHYAIEKSPEKRGLFINSGGQSANKTTNIILDKIRNGIGKVTKK
jgi:adenylate kinase family enzyme